MISSDIIKLWNFLLQPLIVFHFHSLNALNGIGDMRTRRWYARGADLHNRKFSLEIHLKRAKKAAIS